MPTLKKLIIFSVSLITCFFIGIAIDLACGPEPDPYDYYASFFHNTIQDDQGYRPFYFNGLLFLNDDKNPVDEADVNSKEWAAYLGKGVFVKDQTCLKKSANAQIYFLKGRALSKNKEFKARCTFMAAKCRQKQTNGFADDGVGMRHDPYFKALQKHYSKTAFYKVATVECSFFRDFLHPTAPRPKPILKVIVQ